jgi:hypothetical protein
MAPVTSPAHSARRLFRRQANAHSPETVSAAMTGEGATYARHGAERVAPGRTA